MLRASYGEKVKYVWDSLGASKRYSLDPEQPCSQVLIGEDVDLPRWASAVFADSIETYKNAAQAETHQREVDKRTEQRLSDLGYR
jgi:hypothetical protein